MAAKKKQKKKWYNLLFELGVFHQQKPFKFFLEGFFGFHGNAPFLCVEFITY